MLGYIPEPEKNIQKSSHLDKFIFAENRKFES